MRPPRGRPRLLSLQRRRSTLSRDPHLASSSKEGKGREGGRKGEGKPQIERGYAAARARVRRHPPGPRASHSPTDHRLSPPLCTSHMVARCSRRRWLSGRHATSCFAACAAPSSTSTPTVAPPALSAASSARPKVSPPPFLPSSRPKFTPLCGSQASLCVVFGNPVANATHAPCFLRRSKGKKLGGLKWKLACPRQVVKALFSWCGSGEWNARCSSLEKWPTRLRKHPTCEATRVMPTYQGTWPRCGCPVVGLDEHGLDPASAGRPRAEERDLDWDSASGVATEEGKGGEQQPASGR